MLNNPEWLTELAMHDDGRTKTTIEYHLVKEPLENPVLEDIVPAEIPEKSSYSENEYSEWRKKFENIAKQFDWAIPTEGEENDFLIDIFNNYKDKPLKKDLYKKLLTTPNMDQIIRRIVIEVEGHSDVFSNLSNETDEIYLRDTKGLLDIATREDLPEEKNISLTSIGLDGVDSVIFFCTEKNPLIIKKSYGNLIELVMNAVPIFLVKQDSSLNLAFFYSNDKENLSIESVNAFLADIKGKKDLEIAFSDFNDTYKMLADRNILKLGNENEAPLPNLGIFNAEEHTFLLPKSVTLNNMIININTENWVSNNDYKLYRMFFWASFSKMYSITQEFYQQLEELSESGIVNKIFMETNDVNWEILENEYGNYFGDKASEHLKHIRPAYDSLTKEKLENEILSANYRILGPRDGVSDPRFKTTTLLACTANLWIRRLIDLLEIDDLPKGMNSSLVKNLLNNLLYRKYTDNNKYEFGEYLLVDRYLVRDAINQYRKERKEHPFYSIITMLVEEFAIMRFDLSKQQR